MAATSTGRAMPIGHQPPGDVGEVLAVGARVGAQQREGLLDGHVEDFAQEALGLLDDDAAGQRGAQLRHDGRRGRRVLLQDRHARDVGEGLRDEAVGVVELAGVGAEQAERAQDDAGRAHRDGVHGGEAGVERGGDEPGPALRRRLAGRRPRSAWPVA